MKKITLLLASVLGFSLLSRAEEPVKNFSFSGYSVEMIPSESFRIEVENPDLGTQEEKDGTLIFTLKDASGRMPKDAVRIYTNKVKKISLAYSELMADKPLVVDTLYLSLAAGSKGIINVKTHYLQISAGAGSQLTVKGETEVLNCTTKGNSTVNTNELKTKKKI